MNLFYEKLNNINIIELIIVSILAHALTIFFEIDPVLIYIIIIAYVIFRTRTELKSAKEDMNNLFSKLDLKTCILLVLANYILSLGLGLYNDGMFSFTDYNILGQFLIGGSVGLVLLDFISSVIIGPIAEELIFRGIFLNNLTEYRFLLIICLLICGYVYAMPITAITGILGVAFIIGMYLIYRKTENIFVPIIIASGIFGMYHPISAVWSAAVFGVCMCVVYLKTKNIFLAISLHALNNLISFLVPYIPNLELVFDNQIALIIIGILTVIAFIYILKFMIESYDDIKDIKKIKTDM